MCDLWLNKVCIEIYRELAASEASHLSAAQTQGNANVITSRRERTAAFKNVFLFIFVFMWRRVVAQVAIKR